MSASPFKLPISQSLESFEHFSEIAAFWQADFRQLSATNGPTEIFQANVDQILLSSARFSCHVDQGGSTPPGMRTFAILADNAPIMNWYGHRIDANYLLLFPLHGEIDVISLPGFNVHTFSVPEPMLHTWFDRYGDGAFAALAGKAEKAFRLSEPQARNLRKLLVALSSTSSPISPVAHEVLISDLKESLFIAVNNIMTRQIDLPARNRSSRDRAIRKIRELGRSQAGNPLSVAELCSAVGLSERGLQYLFRSELAITPRAFLMGYRLIQAHRALRQAPTGTKVSRIAAEAGFTHFGQFSARYRRQFGQLPSVTLKQSRLDRTPR